MKFKDFKYERPDGEEIGKELNELILKIKNADTALEQIKHIVSFNRIRNTVNTLYMISYIRYSSDTTNEYYEKENSFFDDLMPEFEETETNFYKTLEKSHFKKDLSEKFGNHFFKLLNTKSKTLNESIIEELKSENNLKSRYKKLRASAKIEFDGKEHNLEQIIPYQESQCRKTRKAAMDAETKFWEENENEFDSLYDQLVKTRHSISLKLGFENFIPVGYNRMQRTDYGPEQVEIFRNQVLTEIVPVVSKLKNNQMRRLGIDKLFYYDEAVTYSSGNARPKGSGEDILKAGMDMYKDMSDETAEFITYMIENELFDYQSRKGKSGGGYCTYIPDYKSPFIFSNFNGTSGDVDVLTHEVGHAFQVFLSKNAIIPEYVWPTMDAGEIHSMSMEFFAWPWMKNFFGEDENKYKYKHLTECVTFIPYGALVDEFQHFVYKNPYISPKERKNEWRKLENKYIPHRNYSDNDFLERGGYWFRQGHIFTDPFYYIDYALAQICAFDFFIKMDTHPKKAWNDYIELCKKGGSMSFIDLINVSDLADPFNYGTIKKIISKISGLIEKIDLDNYNE